MPAKNPVFKVVLPKRVATTLKRLAAAGDKSRSAVIRDLLVQAEPSLRRVAGLLEVANRERDQLGFDDAQALAEAMDRLNGDSTAVVPMLEEAARGTRKGPVRAAGGAPQGRRRRAG